MNHLNVVSYFLKGKKKGKILKRCHFVSLKVLHKHVPCRTQEQSLFLTAVENTWIHGRQKRRERLRQLRELPRAPPGQTPAAPADADKVPTEEGPATKEPAGERPAEPAGTGSSPQDPGTQGAEQKEVSKNAAESDIGSSASAEAGGGTGTEETAPSAASEPAAAAQSPGAAGPFLFKCLLNVMCEEGDVVVEMHWVEGQNKDLMNQLCTYLKNTLLKSVAKS